MSWLLLSPAAAFVFLVIGERVLPTVTRRRRYVFSDWVLNLVGFAFQGAVIPLCGYLISTLVLPGWLPGGQGVIPWGFLGCFLLNFVVVDLLYYWQHRLFHEVPWLWKFHQCHHASPTLDVWATARNTAVSNFLFVYMLVNPVLGFLCASPEGFFAGAAATASLDLLRHSRIDLRDTAARRLVGPLSLVFVTPREHHQHHNADDVGVNFGANLILWDRMFGTARVGGAYPSRYRVDGVPGPLQQLFYPVLRSSGAGEARSHFNTVGGQDS
ncbi:MAG: sterol desaturase family protein [Gammaproteobacteria bacterium]